MRHPEPLTFFEAVVQNARDWPEVDVAALAFSRLHPDRKQAETCFATFLEACYTDRAAEERSGFNRRMLLLALERVNWRRVARSILKAWAEANGMAHLTPSAN